MTATARTRRKATLKSAVKQVSALHPPRKAATIAVGLQALTARRNGSFWFTSKASRHDLGRKRVARADVDELHEDDPEAVASWFSFEVWFRPAVASLTRAPGARVFFLVGPRLPSLPHRFIRHIDASRLFDRLPARLSEPVALGADGFEAWMRRLEAAVAKPLN